MKRMTLALALAVATFWTATSHAQYIHSEQMVPMRDGVELAASVYQPDSGTGPWPVVLSRTPYNKDGGKSRAQRYTDNGYVFVMQDVRGRFKSEGKYEPFQTDMEDGYDSVEWVAAQDFSNGKVGMTGASALGITANLAAAADPPHLVCAYVVVAPQSLFYESRFIGGVFKESHAGGWMRSQGVADQIPALKKRVIMDDQWRQTDLVHHIQNIDIPIYNVGGWYDIFAQGNILNFTYLQHQGRIGALGNQKLYMGPFGHGNLSGDLEYPDGGGLRAAFNEEDIRWFDHWLKGDDNGIMDEPAVRYYMMASARKGAASSKNRPITAENWPPKTTTRKLYLNSNHRLTWNTPRHHTANSEYFHIPADPIPTFGGANLRIEKGPMDQRAIGERQDYHRFTTRILEEDVVVAGKINFTLYASTNQLDTDFMVKLVDVYPDGYEAIVVDNPIRARYRNGRHPGDETFMPKNTPVELHIDLWSTAITFEKGHRIAVHISSSNFPRFDINLNNGDEPGEHNKPPMVAKNILYHNAYYPSALILPIVEED